jgi:hypothetical protein
MHVECVREVDASEPDADGAYEYHYEYDVHRFTEDGVCFVARSYTDTPDEAHFLCIECDGRRRLLADADLDHPLFLAAAAHLRGIGKGQLNWLSGRGNGYEPLPRRAPG